MRLALWAPEQSYGWASQCRLGAAPRRRPKHATLAAFGHPGTAVPLGFCALGMTLGAYLGGCEGKPMMNAALLSRDIEGVHAHMADRAPQEDAMVSFIKSGREGWENGGSRVGK